MHALNSHTVLVTGGEQRAALAIVRSLGRAGYRCLVCSATGRSLAGASRHARRELPVPDPAAAPEGHLTAVTDLVDREGVDLLIPVTEASLLTLLSAADRIPVRLPFPDVATFQAICDKARVLDVAAELGISTPAQVQLASPRDPLPDVRPPLVLKPARSVFTTAEGVRGKTTVRWAHSAEGVEAALAGYPDAAYPVLLQEAVEGPGIGVFLLLDEDRVVARFAHRRIREKPPSGGVSVLRQSEPMDAELLEQSVRLLRRFGWTGVAMVEYKQDAATGRPYLMEVNGRFWGSLQLAIDAGVDFPRLLADLSFGRTVAPIESYRHARSRWFWGDVDHLLARWRGRGHDGRGRLAATADWLAAFGPGSRAEVFRWSDPRPFARETRHWFGDALRR